MVNIIFIAPPSAGKGTISEYLINNYGYSHISTGDLLRDEINKNSKIGNEVKAIINQGKLVSDEIISNLLEDKLSKINNAFVLDGYPRNINQAEILNNIFTKLNIKDVCVINLDITKEELLKRVLGRMICPTCHRTYNTCFESMYPLAGNLCADCKTPLVTRDDDNEETFNNRYHIYESETYPIINYFKNNGIEVHKINASNELNVIFNEVEKIIGDN